MDMPRPGGARRIALLLFFLIASQVTCESPARAEMSAFEVRRLRKIERATTPDTANGALKQSRPAPPPPASTASAGSIYVCPMHADFRSRVPAVCAVCGMALQPWQPDIPNDSSIHVPRFPEITLTWRQADLLTLRFADIRPLRIERWIRSAAVRSEPGILSGQLTGATRTFLQPGLPVRAFPMNSRARIFSGNVQEVRHDARRPASHFQIRLADDFEAAGVYVIEIIVSAGTKLAIPSDALLFTNGELLAFKWVRGDTETLTISPVPVRLGDRGEVYYEVLEGLREGDRVALSGLFFLDAAAKYRMAVR